MMNMLEDKYELFKIELMSMVSGFLKDKDKKIEQLQAANAELVEALSMLLNNHEVLVMSGDCGKWDIEDDFEAQLAHKALAKHKGEG
jgi:hypothetical protein